MKNKQRIFTKAMSMVENEEYSCNCLGDAIALDDCENPERVAAVERYRAMYGFGGEAGYDGTIDRFLMAVIKQDNDDQIFGLRILLLGFACEAWDDVGL